MKNLPTVNFDMEVPFYDVDSYRIVWHGNYAKYFEVARCQLLEEIGYPYAEMEKAGYFFPVIDLRCKYVKPIVFKQEVTVSASLKEWRNKLVIDYLIVDQHSKEKLTKARTAQVAIKMPEQITQYQSPTALIQRVAEWMAK